MASSKPMGSRKKAPFANIPHHIMESENYKKLGAWEVKLLLELSYKFRGKNNGDLSATWSDSKKFGWRSKGTLSKAIERLVKYGFIQLTRQGGMHQCSLYALTWHPIDECQGKHEVSPTKTPSNLWKNESGE